MNGAPAAASAPPLHFDRVAACSVLPPPAQRQLAPPARVASAPVTPTP
jgi:hypothetical protein